MKITYDREADAVYIEVREIKTVADTLSITKNVNVDLSEQGMLLGIEILKASKVMDLTELVVKDITNN